MKQELYLLHVNRCMLCTPPAQQAARVRRSAVLTLVHVQVALMQHARLGNVDWKLAAGGRGHSELEVKTLRV